MIKIFTICLFICASHFVSAQVPVFQKSFGGSIEDYGYAVIKTSDGGYAMTGYSNSFSTGGDFDAILIKLDANANFQWSRTYGGTASDVTTQLVQTVDGGFALAGKTTSYGSGNWDGLLVKTDSAGNLQWMKTYGGLDEERLLNLRQTADHGFILSGSTLSYGQGNWDMLFIKTNGSGDTLWTKIIGGIDSDQGTDATQAGDGGFVFLGRERSWGSGSSDIFIMKTNNAGDSIWSRVFGGLGYEEGMKVKQTTDGGYIVTGASTGFTNTSYDVYLNKIDSTGNLSWTKLYAGAHNDATYDILQLADGGFIVTGETETFGNNHLRPFIDHSDQLQNIINPTFQVQGTDHSNVLVVRTYANGDTMWCRAYGGDKMDEAYSIIQTADSGFMTAAFTTGFSTDTTDFYLVKTDKYGYSSCFETPAPLDIIIPPTVMMNISPTIISGLAVSNVIITSPSQTITQHDICFELVGIDEMNGIHDQTLLYPNPVTDKLYVNSYLLIAPEIEIYNTMGERMSGYLVTFTGKKLEITVSKFASGVYTCQMKSGKEVIVKKFVKE